MRKIAILQARMSSTRLPGKILMNICGKPMLEHIVNRISKSKEVDCVIVATTTSQADDAVEAFAKEKGISFFRGSEKNVLERYYICAKNNGADIVVRFTGDNALIDAKIIDDGITFLIKSGCDYTKYRQGLPLGMHIEVFTFAALERAYYEANDDISKEHVTPYIYKNADVFKIANCDTDAKDFSGLRWTADTKEDFQLITDIYEYLYPSNNHFSYEDILSAYEKNQNWIAINKDIRQIEV